MIPSSCLSPHVCRGRRWPAASWLAQQPASPAADRCAARSARRTASSPRAERSRSTPAPSCIGAGGNAIDRRRRVHLRRGGRRDLAFRARRRGSDHHLFRARSKGHRHQRPGSGARAATPADVRGQGRDPRQRSARRAPCRRRSTPASIALAHYGTKSLSDVLAAGDRAGRRLPDVRVPAPLSRDRARRRASRTPGRCARTIPAGRITPVGEMFRQPNLAATLRALCRRPTGDARAAGALARDRRSTAGRDAFYHGPIARDDDGRGAGGRRRDDRRGSCRVPRQDRGAGYRCRIAATRSTRPGSGTRARRCCRRCAFSRASTSPRWAQGSADALHTTVEAIKLAYADRDRYYGDPDFVRVPGDALLSEPYARCARALIDPTRASLEQRPGDPATRGRSDA